MSSLGPRYRLLLLDRQTILLTLLILRGARREEGEHCFRLLLTRTRTLTLTLTRNPNPNPNQVSTSSVCSNVSAAGPDLPVRFSRWSIASNRHSQALVYDSNHVALVLPLTLTLATDPNPNSSPNPNPNPNLSQDDPWSPRDRTSSFSG